MSLFFRAHASHAPPKNLVTAPIFVARTWSIQQRPRQRLTSKRDYRFEDYWFELILSYLWFEGLSMEGSMSSREEKKHLILAFSYTWLMTCTPTILMMGQKS